MPGSRPPNSGHPGRLRWALAPGPRYEFGSGSFALNPAGIRPLAKSRIVSFSPNGHASMPAVRVCCTFKGSVMSLRRPKGLDKPGASRWKRASFSPARTLKTRRPPDRTFTAGVPTRPPGTHSGQGPRNSGWHCYLPASGWAPEIQSPPASSIFQFSNSTDVRGDGDMDGGVACEGGVSAGNLRIGRISAGILRPQSRHARTVPRLVLQQGC